MNPGDLCFRPDFYPPPFRQPQVVHIKGVFGSVPTAGHASTAESAPGPVRSTAPVVGIRDCDPGFAEEDPDGDGTHAVLPAHFLCHPSERSIRRRLHRIHGGSQHPPGRHIVRCQLGFPLGKLSPSLGLEELFRWCGKGVGVHEGPPSHSDAGEGGDVPEKSHLKEAPKTDAGHPQPPLQIPVRPGEILTLPSAPLLKEEDRIPFFRQAKSAHTSAKPGADDDPVPHLGGGRCLLCVHEGSLVEAWRRFHMPQKGAGVRALATDGEKLICPP